MKTFVSGRPYWWQWLTILSLDATLVGLAWQLLFARAARTTLRPEHQAVLGASIWCAYSADRWIEGWRLQPETTLTQRHLFSIRWRWPLAAVWIVVLATDIFVAFRQLNTRELTAGWILLVPVLLYLLSHQLFHRHSPWRLPKELCVALLMTAGVMVFIAADPLSDLRGTIGLACGFAFLCFANCLLISLWEREVDERHGQDSLARQARPFVGAARILPWVITAGAFSATFLHSGWTQRGFGCVAASAALLGLLDLLEPRCGRQLARALADVVLLTPVLAWMTSCVGR